MTRVAAVDCGTNSVKLLVADLDPGTDDETVLLRRGWITRLGQGVDETGEIDPEALERTLDAVAEIADLVREHEAGAVRFVATSAARDARNGEAFLEGVEERLGVRPEVVEGVEEARLSFAGATRPLAGRLADDDEPVLVVDIGGGSTELVLGSGGSVDQAVSLDIGSVRLTERLLRGDPPTDDEVARCVELVDDVLAGCDVDVRRARTLVGVAGTVTTTAAVALDLAEYDHDALHHARLTAEQVTATTRRLLAMSVAERRELGPMHPGRADVIAAGALILDRVVRRVEAAELVVSSTDIVDGIAWSMV